MHGTTYTTNVWTPPYRVCDHCDADDPPRTTRHGDNLLGDPRRGEIAQCDRPNHFYVMEQNERRNLDNGRDAHATTRSTR